MPSFSNETAAADGSGAFRIETTLLAGTWYATVAAPEVGAYRILGQADYDARQHAAAGERGEPARHFGRRVAVVVLASPSPMRRP